MRQDVSVLVVEDDETLRDLYEAILTAHHFQVATAINGLDALNQLKGSQPDLILLDYFMPVMDGISFLKNFDEATYPEIKIIALTNISDPKALDEMIQAGADRHALKSSLEPSDLVALIKDVMKAA